MRTRTFSASFLKDDPEDEDNDTYDVSGDALYDLSNFQQ